MLQPGGGADLGEEALGAEGGAEVGMQHLDGDVAIVLEVVREVDRGHAASAEFALDGIAVGQGLLKPDGCGHAEGLGKDAWWGTG